MRLGLEGGLSSGDVVEPELAHAVPACLHRRPALDYAEAQAPEARQLAHDFRMGTHPMREEVLAAHARLASHQAHALDHGWSFLAQKRRPPQMRNSPSALSANIVRCSSSLKSAMIV